MQNDDKHDDKRPGQPPIHTQLPDSIPSEDAKKIVGEQVPHGADYNSPPPQGASKSLGSGQDDSVGGPGLGLAPAAQGAGTAVRDQDSRADDQHQGNRQSSQVQQGSEPHVSQQQGRKQGRPQQAQQPQPDSRQQGDGRSDQSATPGNAQRDAGSRSEGLLPDEGETDGRYNVAEEVSLDQQSDQARRVGSFEEAAKGPHGDKLAEAVAATLGKDAGSGKEEKQEKG